MKDIKLEEINFGTVGPANTGLPKKEANNFGDLSPQTTQTTPTQTAGAVDAVSLFNEAEEVNYEDLKPGIYKATIAKVEPKEAPWGDKQISIELDLDNGRKDWLNLTYSGDVSEGKLKMNMIVLKNTIIAVTGEKPTITSLNDLLAKLQAVVGGKVNLKIEHKPKDINQPDGEYWVNKDILKIS